jgi:hypothetical protein
MGKDRAGFIVEIKGKLYARICYTDHVGNRKELKRRASDRTEAKKILKDLQAKLDSADRDQCSFGEPACIREKSMHQPMNPPNQSRAVVMVGRTGCYSI